MLIGAIMLPVIYALLFCWLTNINSIVIGAIKSLLEWCLTIIDVLPWVLLVGFGAWIGFFLPL